jgi:transposase
MSSDADRVEVSAGIQRRRRYSADQKLAVLQEAVQPGMTISFVARRHRIAPSLIFGWRRRMSEGGKEAVRADDEMLAKAEVLALQTRFRELERVLGKKTLENEILREPAKLRTKKTEVHDAAMGGRVRTCSGKSSKAIAKHRNSVRTAGQRNWNRDSSPRNSRG